jgi:hypothetical protein
MMALLSAHVHESPSEIGQSCKRRSSNDLRYTWHAVTFVQSGNVVLRRPAMSSPDHLKAEFQNTTRPTLAELRARILADETLPPERRRDMASALASFAKALGQPAETVPADPASLRPRIAGWTPAMVGLKPGRWRNVLSLTTAALAHTGIVLVQGRIREKPSPKWLAILNLLPTAAGTALPPVALRTLLHSWRDRARVRNRRNAHPIPTGPETPEPGR